MNKKIKENLPTVLILLISLKLIDVEKMNVLDYLLIIAACVYATISVMDLIRRR